METIKRVKLTKREFMALQTGSFICANFGHGSRDGFEPNFYGYVVPLDDRDEQWKQMKSSRSDGRTFTVHSNEQECRQFWDDIMNPLTNPHGAGTPRKLIMPPCDDRWKI